MGLETLNNKTSYTRNRKFLNNSVLQYDLPRLIQKLKETREWKNGELASTILLNSPDNKIVLTVLHDDTEIKVFQSGDSVTFQIIEGRMKFHSREETVIIENGQRRTLSNNIKFSLTTHDADSAFLLTINTGSSGLCGN